MRACMCVCLCEREVARLRSTVTADRGRVCEVNQTPLRCERRRNDAVNPRLLILRVGDSTIRSLRGRGVPESRELRESRGVTRWHALSNPRTHKQREMLETHRVSSSCSVRIRGADECSCHERIA